MRRRQTSGVRAALTGLLGLALLGVGAVAPGAAAVAGATTAATSSAGAARPGWAHALLGLPTSGASNRAGVRAGSTLAASPNASNPNICWSQTEGDPAGDATSLDLVSATLEYDCSSKLLTISARTASRFATPSVHDFFGAFDTDANASTGCGGSDLYADAAWVPARNEMEAAIFTVANCTAQPVLQVFLTPKRVDAFHISLSFDPSAYFPHLSNFAWNMFIAPDADNFDVIGNGNLFHAAIPDFPPSGSSAFSVHTPDQVGGSFTDIIPGQFAGTAATDLLLYRAGSGADALWTSNGSGNFTSTPLTINGAYNQIVPGDFNHDGHTDLLFYLAGRGQDFIWFGNGSGGFTSHPFTINGGYHIVPGDFNGDGYTDLLFYAPGAAQDYIWTFHSGGFTSRPFTINGHYLITPGDFTGDGRTDLLFYAPGTAADYIWDAHAVGSSVQFGSHAYPINSVYTNVYSGDFDGNGHDDLFFWSRGWGRDSMLNGTATAPFVTKGPNIVVNEFYDKVVVGDFNNDGKADLFFIQYGSGPDQLWEGA
jgi:hypothetical protein